MGHKESKHADDSGSASGPRANDTGGSGFNQDITISFSPKGRGDAERLRDALRGEGFSVFIDKSNDFRHNGQAIIGSKLFILLLNEEALSFKICRDDLSCAYISNKPIVPVYSGKKDVLAAKLDPGMRLIVSPLTAFEFHNEETHGEQLAALVAALRKHIGEGASTAVVPEVQDGSEDGAAGGNFWLRHFRKKDSISWSDFEAVFLDDYKQDLQQLFPGENTSKLLAQLKQSLFQGRDTLTRERHDEWISLYDPQKHIPFWSAIQVMAIQEIAIRDVFHTGSSVRVAAVENLSKFQTPAVLRCLVELLSDDDANIRTIAAVGLGRANRARGADADAETQREFDNAERELIRCLSDKDRLVRESSCMALANLKSTAAVPGIVHLWRNDAISTVRAAALVSLEGIGGPEAESAMHLTKVLTEEIASLQHISERRRE